ncbi:MAG: rRNA maturation RNase YbeY [bacterium]|nr:rRNA maturation RNase YbeY [bacterium]
MIIDVIALDKKSIRQKRSVVQHARRLGRLLSKKGVIEVYIVGSALMKKINKTFRKKDVATNVLSFEKPKNFPGFKLGEVYLDPAYITRHKEDMRLMLIHGVLHILGYDHMKKGDRINMEKRETELMRKLTLR